MSADDASPLPLLDLALLVGHPNFGEIVLVRHAQQGPNGLNDPARPKGGDAALSELGKRQADAVARSLAGEAVAAVYCSDLTRAVMTATAIAHHHALTPIVDESLREIGIYRDVPAGRTVLDEIGADGIEQIRARFVADRSWDAFPLSETRTQWESRLAAALGRIIQAHAETQRIVVVCHGGVINAIVKEVLGATMDMLFFPAHASITRLRRGDGRLVVGSLNEQAHLHVATVAVTF